MQRRVLLSSLLLSVAASASSYAQTGATFKQWGNETQTKIEQDFRVAGSTLYYENTSHGAYAFNWPQGIEFHAMVASGNTAQAQAMADEIHSRYWCFTNNRWGYNVSAGGCGDRYYDDNAWIAKGLMELYKVNNNATYLNRARDVLAFSMSGENAAPGGSIRWHEGDTSGTCLCATAPTLVANLMIYQATGIAQYLTDGQRLYNWVKANRFGYGPGYRGYENAVVTQGAMLLYRITGDVTYWNDAHHIGLAMETSYVDWTTHALRETGQWGGHDMTAAFTELYQLDGDVYWLNIAAGYLSYLHNNLKDANGRYPETWNSAPGTAGNPALLYQASAARAYFKMGSMPGGVAKYPDPVAIFRDGNYAGAGAGLAVGRYATADLVFHGAYDNDVSSVKVQPGYRVTFYDSDNFTGATLVKTADDSDLSNDSWNDRVSSLVVEPVTPTVTVYKDCNYLGARAVSLPVGDYTLAQLKARGINDNDISSLRVASGYQMIGYDGDNFTGTSLTVGADNSCLVTNAFNDIITSLRVRVGSATPTATVAATATRTATATATARATATPTATTSGGSGTVVALPYNVNAAYSDGTTFAATGGIDGVGSAYSSTLLGGTFTWSGTSFTFGPANQLNGVRNATITLPGGQRTSLVLIGTGLNGDQASQTVRVNYTDGTNSTFTQTFSNWLNASQNVAGQSIAATHAYRNKSTGVKDNRAFNLYAYSFALTGTKTVSSLVLPANNNVTILAATLR
jgi:hypothetical protein